MMYLLSNSTFPCSIVNSKEKGWDKGWSGVCKGSSVKGQGGGGIWELLKYFRYFIKPSVFAGSCDFVCADIYAPVCGTDGKTYGNKCSMQLEACTQKKNVSVAHNGECSE